MKKDSFNKIILDILGERPIAFNPLLAKMIGSSTAGLFMSQLLYWWGKGHKENWIWKTIKEVERETVLSRSEQDSAIRKWKVIGILETKVEGIPPKRHFKIDIDKLVNMFDSRI